MLDRMPNPDTPHLRPDLPTDLPMDQIDRVQRILAQILTYLRAQSRKLPPEADLALTYDLQAEARRK
jgi:hypothetical protein